MIVSYLTGINVFFVQAQASSAAPRPLLRSPARALPSAHDCETDAVWLEDEPGPVCSLEKQAHTAPPQIGQRRVPRRPSKPGLDLPVGAAIVAAGVQGEPATEESRPCRSGVQELPPPPKQ